MATVSNGLPAYPGTPLKVGSTGADVRFIQYCLSELRREEYPQLAAIAVDGIYGSGTRKTVTQYQGIKGLAADGIVGRVTWNTITTDYAAHFDPDPAYPGTPITYGSTGAPVLTMQILLNRISTLYTALPVIADDGIFGSNTAWSTKLFQRQFGLSADGVIGPKTWAAIVSVASLINSRNPAEVTTVYPGYLLRQGSSGDYVRYIQSYLNAVGGAFGLVPVVKVDGSFGSATAAQVRAFQRAYGLTVDGVVGPSTWSAMVIQFNQAI